jgi:hypothetical protein
MLDDVAAGLFALLLAVIISDLAHRFL